MSSRTSLILPVVTMSPPGSAFSAPMGLAPPSKGGASLAVVGAI